MGAAYLCQCMLTCATLMTSSHSSVTVDRFRRGSVVEHGYTGGFQVPDSPRRPSYEEQMQQQRYDEQARPASRKSSFSEYVTTHPLCCVFGLLEDTEGWCSVPSPVTTLSPPLPLSATSFLIESRYIVCTPRCIPARYDTTNDSLLLWQLGCCVVLPSI